MKKISMIFLSLLMIFSSVCLSTSAYDENYDALITAPSLAKPGDVISVTVNVRNIDVAEGTYSNGIFSTAFTLLFDPYVFQPVEYTAVIPSNWEHFERSVDWAEGKWTAFTAWDDDPLDGISADDLIIITFKLKVIGIPAEGSSILRTSDVQGSNGSMRLFYGTGFEATVTFEAFLPRPGCGLRINKDDNTILSAVNNVKVSELKKMFLCDPSVITVKNNGGAVSDDSLAATGMTVSDGVDTYTLIIKGDVDFDGKVTANDYTAVKTHFKSSAKLSGFGLLAADTDENGIVTTSEYLSIRRVIAGKYNFIV